ncbi:MAG: cupredoxin domain-containing protein [Myxococcales bacterium]
MSDGGAIVVSAKRYSFSPANATASQGMAVVWHNVDTVAHTVTSGQPGSPDGKFDQTLQPGASFSYTFATSGSFPYYCRYHYAMGMTGVVTVSPTTNP